VIEPYPLIATQNNWLHNAIVNIIQNIHSRLDNGTGIVTTVRKQETWRGLIPDTLSDDYSLILTRASGVRDRVLGYASELKRLRLGIQQRADIFNTLVSQNDIAGLTSGNTPISCIATAFPTLNDKVINLFLFCYDKLGDVGIREAQYKIIYDSLSQKYCGFCGFGTMMNHEEASQDQDHYFAKSLYPFASANIRNLVPMCIQCNRIHKLAIDIIRDEHAIRFQAFDPYTCQATEVTLIQSRLASDAPIVVPDWIIEFTPASPEAENWERVFGIRERFKRDILNECYCRWFDNFMAKCRRQIQDGKLQLPMSEQQIRNVLVEHRDSLLDDLGSGKDRFKPHVFDALIHLYDSGNERVINHVRDAVIGIQL
jgi:hypothetical protein